MYRRERKIGEVLTANGRRNTLTLPAAPAAAGPVHTLAAIAQQEGWWVLVLLVVGVAAAFG